VKDDDVLLATPLSDAFFAAAERVMKRRQYKSGDAV
jgi:hypothetical protein